VTDHTQECERARAGHRFPDERDWRGRVVAKGGEDPYPSRGALTGEQWAAVMACGHRDHDVVRIFAGVGR
jgi:hypothetical protein